MEKQSTFLYEDITSFFTPSEAIDYYLGKHYNLSLQKCMAMFEQNQFTLPPLLSLFAILFRVREEKETIRFCANEEAIVQLINNDGVKLLMSGMSTLLFRLQQKQGATLANQISLKVVFNLVYVCIDYLELNKSNPQSSRELNQLYEDMLVDDFLMRMVTLSLECHFIPIKKLTMLYTKILANLFHHLTPRTISTCITPTQIYRDSDASQLPYNNLLRYGELEKYKITHPPANSPSHSPQNLSSIEKFYRKHNTGDCPLAQSIVVGLLRSLLTICNCQSHKKFQTVKGGGVDSFREWQLSYRYLIESPQLQSVLPHSLTQRLHSYELYDAQASQKPNQNPTDLQMEIFSEFYSHKIYTTAAITNFFIFMLLSLRQNMFIQESYFLQLISDANGILVFLKFLTDKFAGLEYINESVLFSRHSNDIDPSFRFREKTMLTIYSVLLMLFASCNNYPEKIRNYLFEYNSYLIIKKIPTLFLKKKDNSQRKPSEVMEESELIGSQMSYLPSKEEIDEFALSGKNGCGPVILRKLTELCYDLLKIQIPFFSKKMKENTANMKMIIDIYCKYPKSTEARQLTALDKLLLKSKSGLLKQDKFITSVQEMKTVHNDYNNVYYWSNDFLTHEQPIHIDLKDDLDSLIDPQQWLEDNLWKYYD